MDIAQEIGRRDYSVFFGDVALDEYYGAPSFPVAGDKMIVETLEEQFGGMVANSASVFASLGMRTSFISHLNSGALTQRLLEELRRCGISTEHVIFDDSVPDSKCIIVISGDQHIVLIPALGITQSEFSDAAIEHISGAQFFVTTLTDAHPLTHRGRGAAEVITDLRQRGVRLAMDLDVYNAENHPSELVPLADILFMNRIGFERFCTLGNDPAELLAGTVRAIIVTKDSEGCDVHTATGVQHVAGFNVDIVDVTGAGDTFTGAYLAALSASDDLLHAAEFANAAAAMAVGGVGARSGMTTVDAVKQFIAAHPSRSESFSSVIPTP